MSEPQSCRGCTICWDCAQIIGDSYESRLREEVVTQISWLKRELNIFSDTDIIKIRQGELLNKIDEAFACILDKESASTNQLPKSTKSVVRTDEVNNYDKTKE